MPLYDQLSKAVTTPINQAISEDTLADILSSPPFVSIPGSFNARDLSNGSNNGLRQGYIFRSGTLENISEPGVQALKNLGIQTIFDLRAVEERTKCPTPELPGLEVVWEYSTWDENGPTPIIYYETV